MVWVAGCHCLGGESLHIKLSELEAPDFGLGAEIWDSLEDGKGWGHKREGVGGFEKAPENTQILDQGFFQAFFVEVAP